MFRKRILFISLILFIISFGCDRSSPDPEITGIQPNSGPPGAMVTITGNGFSPDAADNIVSFDGAAAEVISASESDLHATVPEDALTGPVSVSVSGKTDSGPNFTVRSLGPWYQFCRAR